MRWQGIVGSVVAVSAVPASATTVIVYQDPMTMDRRTVVRDTPGPDRAFWCMLPPSDFGCREVPIKRGR